MSTLDHNPPWIGGDMTDRGREIVDLGGETVAVVPGDGDYYFIIHSPSTFGHLQAVKEAFDQFKAKNSGVTASIRGMNGGAALVDALASASDFVEGMVE